MPHELDWIYTAIACTLGATGLALLLWSLFSDRSRGRRRCPKCWYDMSATPGLQCPECGKEPTHERRLFKTRRRWKAASVAALLLILAGATASAPGIRDFGWPWLIPTRVIASVWPMDMEAWLNYSRRTPVTDPVMNEWLRRSEGDELSEWSAHAWARRLERHPWGPYGRNVTRPTLLNIRDLVDLQAPWETASNRRSARIDGQLLSMIETVIDTSGWMEDGGDRGRLICLASWLVVYAPPETTQAIKDLLSAFRAASGTTPVTPDAAAWNDFCSTFKTLQQATVPSVGPTATISDCINLIEKSSGITCAFDDESLYREWLNLDAPLKIELASTSALTLLNHCITDARAFVSTPDCRWTVKERSIVITSILHARQTDWLARIYPIADLISDSPNPAIQLRESLAESITGTIDPDGWRIKGGNDEDLIALADRFIITAPPIRHLAIEQLLTQLRNSKASHRQ